MFCPTRLSMISFCSAALPDDGRLKTSSTLFSKAALLQPDSTMDQNGSGLLVTNATDGRLPAGATGDLEELHAGRVKRTATNINGVLKRMIAVLASSIKRASALRIPARIGRTRRGILSNRSPE